MRSADVEQQCCGVGERAYSQSYWQGRGAHQRSLKPVAIRNTNGAANGACDSRYLWTGWDVVQNGSSVSSQSRGLWTIYGRDGSEQSYATAKLSDALGGGTSNDRNVAENDPVSGTCLRQSSRKRQRIQQQRGVCPLREPAV